MVNCSIWVEVLLSYRYSAGHMISTVVYTCILVTWQVQWYIPVYQSHDMYSGVYLYTGHMTSTVMYCSHMTGTVVYTCILVTWQVQWCIPVTWQVQWCLPFAGEHRWGRVLSQVPPLQSAVISPYRGDKLIKMFHSVHPPRYSREILCYCCYDEHLSLMTKD